MNIRKLIPALILLAVVIMACSKNKFETKPKVEVVDQNTDILIKPNNLVINLEFFDKEGDVTDSIIVVRDRVNKKAIGPYDDPVPYNLPIPSYPSGTTNGEFELQLTFDNEVTFGMTPIPIPGSGTPPKAEPDTVDFKFVLKDKGGNKSDTAIARVIVIR